MLHSESRVQSALATSHQSYTFIKRVFDCIVAVVATIVLAPLMLVIAVLIKLDSPGPVLFRQIRVGKNHKPFKVMKFRTMHYNADPKIHREYVEAFIRNQVSAEDGTTGATPFKLVRDPRITRLGHFLRKTSLDELPQLFNVVLGEMSLVGPRPPLPYEVDAYQEWHLSRLNAMPGITGWWQVWGRSMVSFDEMVRMDLQYIAQQSLWLDLKILILTIPAVLMARGAR